MKETFFASVLLCPILFLGGCADDFLISDSIPLGWTIEELRDRGFNA